MYTDKPEAFVGAGYQGNPEVWCWWSADYPEEGSRGPFPSRADALADLENEGYEASTADALARVTIS